MVETMESGSSPTCEALYTTCTLGAVELVVATGGW